jgi:hypothetical protein
MGLMWSGTVAAGAVGLSSLPMTTSAMLCPGGFMMLRAVKAVGGRSGSICSRTLPMWIPDKKQQHFRTILGELPPEHIQLPPQTVNLTKIQYNPQTATSHA